MAISTYSELRTAVGNWLARSDIAQARIEEFIALFEASANRRLRVRQQETSTTLTPSSGSASLPSDYLMWRRVTWSGDTTVELEYVHPQVLRAYYPDNPAATPRFFSIEGSTLKIRPTDDTGLDFEYFEKIDALSDSATTNWLLTAHPDLYLFGTLTEASAFIVEDERATLWKTRTEGLFQEIEALDQKTRGYGMIRPMGIAIV